VGACSLGAVSVGAGAGTATGLEAVPRLELGACARASCVAGEGALAELGACSNDWSAKRSAKRAVSSANQNMLCKSLPSIQVPLGA
jgi:hypothetical protein